MARLLGRAGRGVQLNEHLEAEGPLVFEHACPHGIEGHRLEAEGLAVSVQGQLPLTPDEGRKRLLVRERG